MNVSLMRNHERRNLGHAEPHLRSEWVTDWARGVKRKSAYIIINVRTTIRDSISIEYEPQAAENTNDQ